MLSQPIPKPISENEICLWYLPRSAAEKERLYRDGTDLLAPDEIARYQSYRRPARAKQFLLGRILMRRSLAAHLAADAHELQFSYGPNGKPELQAAIADGLVFSLSHAQSASVMAIARAERIGVDIENTSRAWSVLGIARQFFSAEEQRRLQPDSAAAAERALILWGLKESVAKASGSTIWEGLSGVKLELGGERIRWLAPPQGGESTWFLICGNHHDDSSLALVVQRRETISQPQQMYFHTLGSEPVSDSCFRISSASSPVVSG